MSVEQYYQQTMQTIDSAIDWLLKKLVEWRRRELMMINSFASKAVDRISRAVDEVEFVTKKIWRPRVVPVRYGFDWLEFEPCKIRLFVPAKDTSDPFHELFYDDVELWEGELAYYEKRDEQNRTLVKDVLLKPKATTGNKVSLPKVPYADFFPWSGGELLNELYRAMNTINRVVIDFNEDLGELNGVGCTVTRMVVGGDTYYVVHLHDFKMDILPSPLIDLDPYGDCNECETDYSVEGTITFKLRGFVVFGEAWGVGFVEKDGSILAMVDCRLYSGFWYKWTYDVGYGETTKTYGKKGSAMSIFVRLYRNGTAHVEVQGEHLAPILKRSGSDSIGSYTEYVFMYGLHTAGFEFRPVRCACVDLSQSEVNDILSHYRLS